MTAAFPSTSERRRGAGLVAVAIAAQALWLGLPAAGLSVALVVCYALWRATDWRAPPVLGRAVGVAILVFVGHATEELITGFPRALPALLGRPPWTDGRFLAFNAAWLVVFLVAWGSLRSGRGLPVLPVLFLAIAGGVGNGVGHVLLAWWVEDTSPAS